MKKITMFLVLAGFIAGSLTAQEQFVNLDDFRKAYIAQYARFGITEQNWKTRIRDNDPTQDAHIVALGGNPNYNDTPLEIALYAHYCPVADPIPAEADRILPRNNPRLVDRQLGAYVYKDLIVYRFLNDTAAVNRHESMLQYITGRGNATRAEIETFYRNNIRALISQVVDEEAAKRQPTNSTTIAEIKQIITNFFLDPTLESHNVLYQKQRQYSVTDGNRGRNAHDVLIMAIAKFNLGLADTVANPSRLVSR